MLAIARACVYLLALVALLSGCGSIERSAQAAEKSTENLVKATKEVRAAAEGLDFIGQKLLYEKFFSSLDENKSLEAALRDALAENKRLRSDQASLFYVKYSINEGNSFYIDLIRFKDGAPQTPVALVASAWVSTSGPQQTAIRRVDLAGYDAKFEIRSRFQASRPNGTDIRLGVYDLESGNEAPESRTRQDHSSGNESVARDLTPIVVDW